jgi:hypothetical protein
VDAAHRGSVTSARCGEARAPTIIQSQVMPTRSRTTPPPPPPPAEATPPTNNVNSNNVNVNNNNIVNTQYQLCTHIIYRRLYMYALFPSSQDRLFLAPRPAWHNAFVRSFLLTFPLFRLHATYIRSCPNANALATTAVDRSIDIDRILPPRSHKRPQSPRLPDTLSFVYFPYIQNTRSFFPHPFPFSYDQGQYFF